jgi:protein-disulfide isomerase
MTLKDKLLKNKFFFLLILLLAISLAGCSLASKKAVSPTAEQEQQASADSLKEANKEALIAGEKAIIKPVRAIDSTDHIKGDIKAPVQIIIYSDFECPFCAGFKDTIDQVLKNFSEKVVIAFRQYPLRSHPLAVPAALASECAAEQGKFWEMHDKLFADNKAGKLSDEQFNTDATDIKLDMVKFKKCYDTQKYLNKIQAQMIEAINFGVIGTPGVFVNGEPLPGAYPYEDFKGSDGQTHEGLKKIIERHLADVK